ncbi:MAG: AAA family ATPase [Jiangellaceae bacterium]
MADSNTHQPPAETGRGLGVPHNPASEMAVLGAVLRVAQDDTSLAATLLAQAPAPHDYYRPNHETLAAHLQAAANNGGALDPGAILTRVINAGDLRQGLLDGPYIQRLLELGCPASSIPWHADVIRKLAVRRRQIEGVQRALQRLTGAELDDDGAVYEAMADLENVTAETPQHDPRLIDGGSWLFDHGPEVEPLWGQGDDILWAGGESLLIAAPTGVGKTTIAQQVVLAGMGLRKELLGHPVHPMTRVLYLAMDRPNQARRSLARMLEPQYRDLVEGRLVVWRGPPPGDIVKDPTVLVELARKARATVVVIDSLKDTAVGIAKDEVGTAVNIALQHMLADGIDVLALHHVRKSEDRYHREPTSVDEIYGSSMITNGAGSIVLLWGEPGDAIVKFRHLKQPAGEVGPFTLRHDHASGTTEIEHGVDVLRAILNTGTFGLTPAALASIMFPRNDGKASTRNEVMKARRRLERLVTDGLAHRVEGEPGRGGTEARYFAAVDEHGEVRLT